MTPKQDSPKPGDIPWWLGEQCHSHPGKWVTSAIPAPGKQELKTADSEQTGSIEPQRKTPFYTGREEGAPHFMQLCSAS